MSESSHDWVGQKENIKPRRKGQSSAYLAGLAKQHDPELQSKITKEQDEWENRVRFEGTDNPMIWYDYYKWANENIFNSYQLKVLQHKALSGLLNSEKSLERFGNNDKVFEMFTNAVDEAKNWEDLFSFVRSKGFFVHLSKFWTLWADHHEKEEGVREADEVLTEGERYLATDKEELAFLRKWRQNLDIRIALGRSRQRDTGGHNEVKKDKSRPTRKFGTSIKEIPGQREKPTSKNNGRKGISIFKDKTTPTVVGGLEGDWNRDILPPNTKTKGKENKVDAGKWNKGGVTGLEKCVPKASALVISKDGDVDEDFGKPMSSKTCTKSHLKEIRPKSLNQLWSFSDTQNTVANIKMKPMYRKKEVYLGLKETSFEELKAFKYFRSVTKDAVVEEALRNVCTPKQQKLNEDELLKRSQPTLESNLNDLTPIKLQFCESNLEDLGCGLLPETPELRDRKLSAISEEASVELLPDPDVQPSGGEPKPKVLKKKPTFQIFCDSD